MSKRVVILDTNVVLDLYSYTDETAKGIINVLGKLPLGYELFIPKRVCFEFFKNKKRRSDRNPITKLRREIVSKKNSFESFCNNLKANEVISKRFNSDFANLVEELSNTSVKYKTVIESLDKITESEKFVDEDERLDAVYQFMELHRADYFKIDELLDFASKFELRIKCGIPTPGMTDIYKKPDEIDPFRCYGDFIIWQEIKSCAKEFDDIIFLTNEKKEDWWEDKTFSAPKNGLLSELKELNPNCEFRMLSFNDFVLEFEEYFPVNACDEMKNLSATLTSFLSSQEFTEKIIRYYEQQLYEFNFDLEIAGNPTSMGTIDEFDISEIEDVDVKNINHSRDEYGYVSFSFDLSAVVNGTITEQLYEDVCDYWDASFSVSFSLECLFSVCVSESGLSVDFEEMQLLENPEIADFKITREEDENQFEEDVYLHDQF